MQASCYCKLTLKARDRMFDRPFFIFHRPLGINFYSPQPSAAIKIKDGGHNIRYEITYHSLAKITPALQAIVGTNVLLSNKIVVNSDPPTCFLMFVFASAYNVSVPVNALLFSLKTIFFRF